MLTQDVGEHNVGIILLPQEYSSTALLSRLYASILSHWKELLAMATIS
jgi:hypothetical protein